MQLAGAFGDRAERGPGSSRSLMAGAPGLTGRLPCDLVTIPIGEVEQAARAELGFNLTAMGEVQDADRL